MLNPVPAKMRAPSHAFSRHHGIYYPMWCFLNSLGRGAASLAPRQRWPTTLSAVKIASSRWTRSRRARARLKDAREVDALTHRLNEFRTGYSLNGLLASIARLRFTGHPQIKTVAPGNGTIYHRTVANLLTVCLSSGGNPSGSRRDLKNFVSRTSIVPSCKLISLSSKPTISPSRSPGTVCNDQHRVQR